MENQERRVGIVADIGFRGARESSRQSGRTAEKAEAWPIRAGLPTKLSLTAYPPPSPATPTASPAKGGLEGFSWQYPRFQLYTAVYFLYKAKAESVAFQLKFLLPRKPHMSGSSSTETTPPKLTHSLELPSA